MESVGTVMRKRSEINKLKFTTMKDIIKILTKVVQASDYEEKTSTEIYNYILKNILDNEKGGELLHGADNKQHFDKSIEELQSEVTSLTDKLNMIKSLIDCDTDHSN